MGKPAILRRYAGPRDQAPAEDKDEAEAKRGEEDAGAIPGERPPTETMRQRRRRRKKKKVIWVEVNGKRVPKQVNMVETLVDVDPDNLSGSTSRLGCCNVKLRNEMGKAITTTVYVTEHEKESLLGKEDAIKFGILKISPKGELEDAQEEKAQHVIDSEEKMRLRCITPQILEEIKTEGVVSDYDSKRVLEVANMGSQDEDT